MAAAATTKTTRRSRSAGANGEHTEGVDREPGRERPPGQAQQQRMRPVQRGGEHRRGHQQQRDAVLARQPPDDDDVGEEEQHAAADARSGPRPASVITCSAMPSSQDRASTAMRSFLTRS